jgi:subtilisin-like proprotein convertase family protein
MKIKFCLTVLLLVSALPAWAALYNFGTLNGDAALGAIPDNNMIGLTEAATISGEGSSLSDVVLTVVLQGGFSSDLSGYLRLGNETGSTAYNLTSLVQGQTLSGSSANTYTIDLGTTFASENPNNTWTLFFADTSAGGVTTLNGWSLDVTAVPEPVNVALEIFLGLFAVGGGVSCLRRAGNKEIQPKA